MNEETIIKKIRHHWVESSCNILFSDKISITKSMLQWNCNFKNGDTLKIQIFDKNVIVISKI